MYNKKNWLLISLLTLIFMVTACSSVPKFITNEGKFSKSSTDTITVEYTIKSSKGFYASLGFELTDGKVDWEIVNSKNETEFKGYVNYEDGKVYRELTYPLNYSDGTLNKKEEVKSKADANGTVFPEFSNLSFSTGSAPGKYTLKLKPLNAEGNYKMVWSDKFPKK